jgi:hypothetical protein
MKLPVTLVTTHETVVIDVEPAVYNRAVKGVDFFQAKIIDLTREQLAEDEQLDLTWDAISVGEPNPGL